MTKREKFVEVAHTWIGVPWRPAGSSREGVNCLGLLVGIARECDFFMDIAAKEAEAQFTTSPIPGWMMKRAKEDLDMILMKHGVPGDLVIFRIADQPQHIALITDLKPLQFIHSDWEYKVVRKSVALPDWHPVAAFRIRELDE